MESYYVPSCPLCKSYDNAHWSPTLDTRYKWYKRREGGPRDNQRTDPWNYVAVTCSAHNPWYHYWSLCILDNDVETLSNCDHWAFMPGDTFLNAILYPGEWLHLTKNGRTELVYTLYEEYPRDSLEYNVFKRHRWFYENFPEFFEELT